MGEMMVQGGQSLALSAAWGPRDSTGPDTTPRHLARKRKAESQENERLSKRLSLLNIEHNGSKLYVPVETTLARQPPSAQQRYHTPHPDSMRLDNTRHKVYIYNMDDELSSDSDADDASLVFLPDIDKHLRENRIPPHVLANNDGQLAGMQMVLYSDPRSLTVPEDQDGVRKAVIDARRRLREEQRQERQGRQGHAMQGPETQATAPEGAAHVNGGDAMDLD